MDMKSTVYPHVPPCVCVCIKVCIQFIRARFIRSIVHQKIIYSFFSSVMRFFGSVLKSMVYPGTSLIPCSELVSFVHEFIFESL